MKYGFRSGFPDLSTPGEYETDILYSDSYFLEDARVYNHRLAQLSMATAVASFRWDFDDDP